MGGSCARAYNKLASWIQLVRATLVKKAIRIYASMTKKHKRHSPEFKANVALETIQSVKTVQ